jgi:hypothetical protein
VVNGTAPYVAPSGQVVAPDFKTLQANGFSHVPSDENGVEIGGDTWTGATDNAQTCDAWMSADPGSSGMRGKVDGTGGDWTVVVAQPCNATAHLYCFED